MSTFGAMQAEIADDLARSDLTTQIKSAIKSAIRFYERKRFFFNETTGTFSLVVGQKTYDATDLAAIPDMVAIDSVRLLTSGTYDELKERSFDDFLRFDNDTSTTGDPTDWAYYGKKLYLYPTPDAVRTVSLAYAYKLPELSLDADTNAWMTDGYDLVKARAKADLFENVIRDYDEADRMRLRANELLTSMNDEYGSRTVTRLKPTQF